MKNLIEYGKEKKLSKIRLEATDEGRSIYENVGFKKTDYGYTSMEISL